jgi:dTDP-4-amino-4,6-dideoxygalactose transaminase
LQEHINKKKQIYDTYKKAFKNLPVQMNPYTADSEPNYWLSCMLIDKDCKVSYQEIMEALQKENIESRPIWKPMHLQPVFKNSTFISVNDNTSKIAFNDTHDYLEEI